MRTTLYRLRGCGLIGLFVVAAIAVGCSSGSQTTKDDGPEKVVEKSKIEKLSEETGLQTEAIEKFKAAVDERNKDEPDNKKIEGLLTEVVELEPKFAEAHYNLGVLYTNLNKPEEAVEHLDAAHEIAPEVLDYTVALAQAYASAEDYTRARDMFREVVSRQPDNLTAKNNLAVMALRQGDEEAAMNHVRDVLREDNENVGALNVLGLIYRKRGNMSLAKYAFQKALEQDEGNADIHNNLGLVYLQEEDTPSAVDHFEAAVASDPNYLESRLNIGAIFLEYLDYKRAYNQFDHAVRIAPNQCMARLGKGATAFATSEYETSAENYEYYVDRCDSEHVSSYERLANLYQNHLDDREQALTYYEKLMDLVDEEEKRAEYKATIQFMKEQMESGEQKGPEEESDSSESDGSDEKASGDEETSGDEEVSGDEEGD